jgi:hypothetical protein
VNRSTLRWKTVARVATRPRAWILRYLLHLLPAALLAVLIAGSMLFLFRYPLMAEALRTRSLGDGLEIVQMLGEEGAGAEFAIVGIIGALGLALLAWLPVQLAGLWLEGGVLQAYAADQKLDGRAFRAACGRTFGPFLLLSVAQHLAIGLVAGIAVASGVALGAIIIPVIVAVTGIGALMMLGELARIAIVVDNDRHVVRGLGRAIRLARRRFLPLVVVIAASIGLQALLFVAQRAAGRVIPIPWWALSLIVLQIIQILGVGVRLARQAGIVSLAQDVRPHVSPPDA